MYVQNLTDIPVDNELSLSAKKKDQAGLYTWETKIKLVATLLATGNMALAARTHNIPYETAQQWKQAAWWPKLLAEVRASARAELQTKMSKIVTKALDAVEDRVENGEVVLNNKTGELLRKPASLRDVTNVANNMLTQQIKLEEMDKTATVEETTVVDLLKQLSLEFAKFNSNVKKNNATDVAFKDK